MASNIIQGDALEVLKTLESESIDFTMTSPPYWGLRDYKTQDQLGLEPRFDDYINKLIEIFHEVKRVTKRTGCCYVNIGDTYAGSGANSKAYPESIEKNPEKWNSRNNGISINRKTSLSPKTLMGIPERFYLRMIDDGWIPRNKIIWWKRNHMPSSVQDRLSNCYEFLYHFVKTRRYFYDLDKIREPLKQITIERIKSAISNQETFDPARHKHDETLAGHPRAQSPMEVLLRVAKRRSHYQGKFKNPEIDPEKAGSPRAREMRKQDNVSGPNHATYEGFNNRWNQKHSHIQNPQQFARKNHSGYLDEFENPIWDFSIGKNPGDVWDITTQGHRFAHFAVYPLALVFRPMISSSPPHSIILDPFCGSGTTLIMAKLLMRKYIGIEINSEYIKIAESRLGQVDREIEILNELIGDKIQQAGAMEPFLK